MKRSRKVALWISLTVVITLAVSATVLLNQWRFRDLYFLYTYDRFNSNETVHDIGHIDRVINSLKPCRFEDLDYPYLKYTKYLQPEYRKLTTGCTFYKITRNDLYRHIVSNFRIKDLLPGDIFYIELIMGKRDYIYLNIRKDLLYKLLMLQDELKKSNYNPLALSIRTAFRYPLYNERIGGAKFSEHIKGTAIDISVGDIDRSGFFSQKDKKIVMDILNRKVIMNSGGIGRYPGTSVVHFDVRGHKARWDHMKKKTVASAALPGNTSN